MIEHKVIYLPGEATKNENILGFYLMKRSIIKNAVI